MNCGILVLSGRYLCGRNLNRKLDHPKAVGEASEALVLARLVQLGYAVSIPFGDNQRYDFIVDDGDRLVRSQVKTGRLENGCVAFQVCSSTNYKPYHGEIDEFLVVYPPTGEIYRVPIDKVGKSKVKLRVDPPKVPHPNQIPLIKWASDYILR